MEAGVSLEDKFNEEQFKYGQINKKYQSTLKLGGGTKQTQKSFIEYWSSLYINFHPAMGKLLPQQVDTH